MSTGFVLNIPQEMLNRLDLADQKIRQLAKTSEDSQVRIVSAFQSIGTHGIDAFINRLTEAQTRLVQLGNTPINVGVNANAFSGLVTQAQNAIDEVNRVVTAVNRVKKTSGEVGMAKNPFAGMSESLKQWNNLQSQIDAADAKIKKLTSTTMDYERQMQRMRSGQSTPITVSTNEYAYTQERIAALQEEKRVLREKQEEITRQNNSLSEQVRLQESLKRFVTNQNSLPEQRKRQEYEAMRQMYIEDEKASEAAEKKKLKDAEDAEKRRQQLREQRVKEEQKAAERAMKAYERQYKQLPETITTKQAGQLVARSMNATSIEQRQVAIKNLQTAINNLDSTDKRYDQTVRKLNAEIRRQKDELNKLGVESNKVRNSHRGLLDISGQLARSLSLMFSVHMIAGYVKKLIEVRGEFELQQRSLQAILQNKDKANEVWQKTVDLAIKSPFRVKELVSYTKQLAAYRIESDKLFETNKMLADISAGLGVDMQRLILAFGQVRSAAYLRGTELRQFTEAGIPILEQLAKYFTELEGRAVSVGDVFERVSKRMVSFADVEEIFKRMTSEGGTFYRMQEIQAGTLKGMWSNLKDSVDLMIDDIGKDGNSILKNSISFVKALVDNWRILAPIIKTVGLSFITYFGIEILRKIGAGFKNLWSTMAAHPYLAIASAVGVLVTYIWNAIDAQNKFNAAMSEVENENIKSLEDNIRLYHELREAINDVTKSSEEREKAYKQLESVFGEILPQEYLAKEYIEDLSKGYRDAEKAMMDYYDAKTQAQKKDRIEGLYAKELDEDASELISALRDAVNDAADDGIISKEMQTAMLSGVSGVVNKVVEKVKKGELDVKRIYGEMLAELEKYAGYEGVLYYKLSTIDLREQVSDIQSTLREYLSSLEDIPGLPSETYGQKVASEWLNKEKESLKQISDIYKKLLSLYSKYSKSTDQDKVKIAEDISMVMSQVPEKLSAYLPLLQDSVDKMKEIAEKGAFEFTASMQTLESDFVMGLAGIAQYATGEIGDVNGNEIAQKMSKNLQEGIKTASDKLDMTPFQNAVVGGARQIAERFGQDVNIFEKFLPNQKESLSNIRQEVKSQIESYETQIKEMQLSLTQGMYVLSEDVLNNTKKKIESMTKQIPALKAFLAFLGEEMKGDKSKDKTLDERIKVVDQMNAKYKELNKTLSKTESLEGAFAAYKDAFATAYGREDVRQMSAKDFAKNVLNFPDENAVIAWLDKLAKTVKNKEDKFKVQLAKGKFEMDATVRLKQKDDQKLRDDVQKLLDRYELSLELKKLNIPPDLAKSLFKVDYLDLDGLKKAVQEQEPKFIGTDMEKSYKEFLDKIKDLEDKAAKERMKTYSKYLLEGMSERVKLKIEEMRKLKEIEESKEFTPEQKKRIKEGVSEEARKEQQKQEWKDFKESGMYTMMFEDLEHYGTEAINMLYQKLSNLKKSLTELPANEVKEIVQQIEKLENIKIERNPFKELVKYSREVKKIGFSEEELQGQLRGLQEREAYAQRIIDIIHLMEQASSDGISQADALAQLSPEQLDAWRVAVGLQKQLGGTMNDVVQYQEKIVKKSKDGQTIIVGQLSSYKKLSKAQQEAYNKTETWLNAVGDVFSASKELMEALGVESDSVAMTIADTGSSMVSLILSAIQFTAQLQAMGVAANSALGIIGWIAIAIQAVATILSAIFSARDNDLKKQVESHLSTVENLQKRYETLEDAIDDAWSTTAIQQYNKELQVTTKSMIAAQRDAIASQGQRKGANEYGSDEYNELQDMKAELDEMEKQLEESLAESFSKVTDGILDSVHDAAKEFTDAWWDAFIETGDGLSGLEENFNEMFLNLAKNQAAMQITGAFAERWKKDLEKYINADDTKLTKDEAKKWAEEVRKTMPELSAALEGYLGAFKDMATTEGSGLSALQKGIQGITEDQADVLAAYWNSVRGYTASIDSKMDLVLANLGASAEDNPMLEQMRLVAKNTSAINTLLNSLVKGGHPQGGQGLKVFID